METAVNIDDTERGEQGFGCTGPTTMKQQDTPSKPSLPSVSFNPTTASAAVLNDDDHTPICNIDISSDPFNDHQVITMTTRGFHPTQGLILEQDPDYTDIVVIKTCKPGTAASKVLNWRTRLKQSALLEINGTAIYSINQAKTIFSNIPRKCAVQITVGLSER